MNFCFFDARGNILSTFTGPSAKYAELQGGDFIRCGELIGDTTHYVDTVSRTVVAKQALDTTYRVVDLEVLFDALPAGLTLVVDKSSVVTDEGSNSVEFDIPGTYMIELSGLPEYLDEVLEVTLG